MGKAFVKQLIIIGLQEFHERESFFMRRYRLTDEPELHERYQQHGYQQRDAQNQCNGPGETQQEVVYHAGNHNQEGEECDTDGQCSREYGLEEMRGTEDRRMPARHSFADFLQITVDDDNGVVHNHSQRHNQGSQRHGVQLNAKGIEKSQ